MLGEISFGDLHSNLEIIYEDKEFNISIIKNNLLIHDRLSNEQLEIFLPKSTFDYFTIGRISSRLLRTNKCNALRLDNGVFIFFRQNTLFSLCLNSRKVSKILDDPITRNVMQNSLCRLDKMGFVYGDYFSNPNRGPVYLKWIRNINEQSLHKLDITDFAKCRHVHNVQYLSDIEQFVVSTGDLEGECWLMFFDKNLNFKNLIGDGGQTYRTCAVHFWNDCLYWGMDSPLERSFLFKYNLRTRELKSICKLPGPCLYSILKNGRLFLSTSDEPSKINAEAGLLILECDSERIIFSQKFKKDWYPYKFKFGVGTLINSSDNQIWICYEALSGLDGKCQTINVSYS